MPGKLALGSPLPSSQSVQIASRPSSLDLGVDKYMRNKEEDKKERNNRIKKVEMHNGIHDHSRLGWNDPSSLDVGFVKYVLKTFNSQDDQRQELHDGPLA